MVPRTHLVTIQKRRRHWLRFLGAIWRDSSALLREFWWPIAAFVIITVGGGYVYGELYAVARDVHIELIDRPYIMLQLMILETPEDVPPEWYLVIFWYLLPVAAIFIIGRGVVDFVRLFFDRSERRDAWRAAVASTYRNHIIVFGAGHVGLRVVRVLAEMGMDVIVIDDSPGTGVEDTLAELGAPLIVADGRLTSTLEKCALRNAFAFVACTGNDHVNLEAIMKARDLNPDVRIVARVWDNQFANQIERFMNVQSVISSSDMSAPFFAASALGVDITQTLHVNGVEYSMLRLIVSPGSFVEGRTVGQLQREESMDIVLHSNGSKTHVQPAHDIVVKADDTLVIFAEHARVLSIVSRNYASGKSRRKRA